MRLEGVIPPMPTPTDDECGIDTQALRSYTRFLLDNGVDGLFPCGSVGEFSSLTPQQRETVVETVTDEASVPVLAGCGDTSLALVEDHVQSAADRGADAAVVVTPYYLDTTQSGFGRFYEAVAETAPIPILLYNIPALTGERLSVELIRDLAAHDNIIGLKDSSGDLTFVYDVIRETPDDFAVLQGATQLSVASLEAGVDGLVAGTANVFPDRMTSLYNSFRRNERERVDKIQNELVHPVVSATSDMPTAPAIKYLVSRRGYDIGESLPPLPELNDEERARLDGCYDRVTEGTEDNREHGT